MKTASPVLLAQILREQLNQAVADACAHGRFIPLLRIVTVGNARELAVCQPFYNRDSGEITIGVEVDALVPEPPPLGDLAGLPDPETARAQAVATAEAGHPMKGAVDDMLATMVDVARTAANPEPLVIIGQGDGARKIFP